MQWGFFFGTCGGCAKYRFAIMTKLSAEAGAYDLVITDDWLYYRISTTRIREVPYRYYKIDFNVNVEVSKSEFNQAKYRADILPNEDGEEVIFMPDGNTLRCFYQESTVRVFSPEGNVLHEVPELPIPASIYSIALDKNGYVWTVAPSYHHIGQYDLKTGQTLFELGGTWDAGDFNHPEDIAIYDGYAFISDMGNYRIVILDLNKKSFGTYRNFNQRVWQYRRFKNREIVRLEDGIYIL
jgi:WD40 repeat protein